MSITQCDQLSIGQEIDDSVDLTPGDMFHLIVVYWDDVFSFRNRYTLSSLSTRNTQHCHSMLKIDGDMFHIINAGGVCVFSQPGRVISTKTDECPKLLPSDCYWASHSRKLMNANGDI